MPKPMPAMVTTPFIPVWQQYVDLPTCTSDSSDATPNYIAAFQVPVVTSYPHRGR